MVVGTCCRCQTERPAETRKRANVHSRILHYLYKVFTKNISRILHWTIFSKPSLMLTAASPLKRLRPNIMSAVLTAQSLFPSSDETPSLQKLVQALNNAPVVSSCADVPEGKKKIGTHSGTFHCDEALGCAMLQLHPDWSGSAVVRSRDASELAKCDIVIDVGAVYDHESRRYDHHQRSFDGILGRGFSTKLSACGLVYKHYGQEVIAALYPEHSADVDLFYDKLYSGFVEHVDAIDNGIEVADGPLKYSVSTTLSSRVGSLNPRWNQKSSPEDSNERFRYAMLTTGRELLGKLHNMVSSWFPARSIVVDAVEKRKTVHPSGKVVLLDGYCPWGGHIHEVEKALNVDVPIEYVLYPDSSGKWRIQCVPVEPGSFQSRRKLPDPWCGVRDEALSELTGIDGCIFVHAAGFIGGTQTKEGILELAEKAVAFE